MAFARTKKKSRSPVAEPPRRMPGQSVRAKIEKLAEDKLLPLVMMPVVAWIFAGTEFYKLYFDPQPRPGMWAIVAVAATAFAGWRLVRLRREFRRLHQAERGERRVGELLDQLRQRRYVPFHDIVTDDFNIDHVLVGAGGVYAIETKAYSLFGNGQIAYTASGKLLLSGREALGNPLGQARFAASEVARLLEQHLQRRYRVQAVLVFPGWTVQDAMTERDVVILDDKSIAPYFRNREPVLTGEEVRDICSHLDRTARS